MRLRKNAGEMGQGGGEEVWSRRAARETTCRVFTTFRILEISYISNVFLGFVCHSKMAPISRNYTKFFLPFFYANLYKIPGISRNSVTFYTNFSTIHHRRHILHTAEKLQYADWGWGGGKTTEYISLQEMKQGQCICPLSWSVHCNFTGDGKCNKRGWACNPHPHQPGPILPSSLNVRQKADVTTLCTLCIEHRAGKAARLASWRKMTQPGGFLWWR